MSIEQRVAQRFVASGWQPWSDPTWKNEGFQIALGDIGYATMSKPKKPGAPWLCRVYFGGGAPTVTGEGKVPAQAASDAKQKLERVISVLR